jgi:hypothetical protein
VESAGQVLISVHVTGPAQVLSAAQTSPAVGQVTTGEKTMSLYLIVVPVLPTTAFTPTVIRSIPDRTTLLKFEKSVPLYDEPVTVTPGIVTHLL